MDQIRGIRRSRGAKAPRATGRSFRVHLAAFAASLVLPAILCMALLLVFQFDSDRTRFEQQLLATARAISGSVDRQVAEGIAVNETLAASDLIAQHRYGELGALARRALKGRSGWIVLSDAQNRQLVNTATPDGKLVTTPFPTPPNISRARAERRSRVSDLVTGRLVRRPIVAIDTPVFTSGQVYDLSYIHEPSTFYKLLKDQRLPPGWLAAILDRNQRVVARTQGQEQFVGAFALPETRAHLGRFSSWVGPSRSFEGAPTLLAYNRSPTTGWTLLVSVPRRQFDQALARASWGLGLTLVLLLAVGGGLAIALSRRLGHDLRNLVEDATALGRSDAVYPRRGLISETQQVQSVLTEASRQLQARDKRHDLMIGELNHRVKNTLATVQALANQTFGRSSASTDPVAHFNGRLLALARAHDLLTSTSWGPSDLKSVFERCNGVPDQRIRLQGPHVEAAPQAAIALCMIAHELTTNSLKYGALSAPSGEVRLEWVHAADGRLHVTWTERGGPPVSPPKHQGFGSRMIERLVRGELEGSVAYDYRPEGLAFTAELSLASGSRWDSRFP